ncbi:AraC family transcriptional regulator [Pendulispora albinea]|uniref:AraC family transcriptional regulator n=1 Tax=Pendulispora albinea TaxID=2741071 RepID=A0ABZ2MCS9_9BACT
MRVPQVSRLPFSPTPKPTSKDGYLAGELLELVARGATNEGDTESVFSGFRFLRVSKPSSIRKWHAFGPMLIVVAQGRKVATYRGVSLAYDPLHYLVVTGEAEFAGKVIEAAPEKPFLAFCYAIPPDVVAKTLLTLADANDAAPMAEPVPAFVAPIDTHILDCSVRWLRAIEDPLERRVVAPLVVEELVFRLLRTDAAAAVRSAVGQDRDTDKVESAMLFLQANVERALSVEDVARHVAMSPSHFAHRFRAVARVSPMRYLKQLRLQHARTLMIAEGLRVGEAAARAGYESTSHFTRDFRGFFGASPGEYVRRVRDR